MTEVAEIKPPVRRIHRIDGWRSYPVPALAVAGTSYTGEWEDSPAKKADIYPEINRLRNEVLKPANIKSRLRAGTSSNIFCQKVWVVVSKDDFDTAARLVTQWLEDNKHSTSYLHDADLDQLGYEAE